MTVGTARRGLPTGLAWLLLAIVAVLLAVANGRWSVWPAAWLAPMLLVVFVDSQPPRRGLGAAFVVQTLAFFVNWWGMIPVPGAWYYLVAGIYAFAYFLPFVLHRLTLEHVHGMVATLVLPMSWVVAEFLFQQVVTPYGSWASLAYTQVDNLPLLQLASVTGTSGISFLILWCASVMASLWRNRQSLRTARSGALVFAAVLLATLAWGQYRVASAPEGDDALRIASLTPSRTLQRNFETAFRPVTATPPIDDAVRARATEAAGVLNADLLNRTRRQAQAGAKLVVWSEHAARVTRETEGKLIEDARTLARELDIILIMGIGVWDPDSSPSFENKAVAIQPDGEVALSYSKARPIVGSESSLIARGDPEIGILETRHGILATVICHDLDFPDFIRTAGKRGVAVLFGPSSDWTEIASLHARMATVRAVENGCSLVRPCANGLSAVADPLGRIVATEADRGDHGTSLDARLTLIRKKTIYPLAGDFLAYLSLAGLLVVLLWSRYRSRR